MAGKKKKVGTSRTAAEVRAESKRRKRELPSQLRVLKAELTLALARLRKTYRDKGAAIRARATVAGVRRGK